MSARSFFSAARPELPIVRILPSLEALISVRSGDDPERALAFWEHLSEPILSHVPFVWDNRAETAKLPACPELALVEIRMAIMAACGYSTGRVCEWASIALRDSDDSDVPPKYSCGLSLGWVNSPEAPRGISIRLTTPPEYSLTSLLDLVRELAAGWPEVWRWMTIGYRFEPVCLHSSFFEEARRVIQGRSKRFLAVDVGENLGLYTSFWQDWIRTVQWGTVLSPGLLEAASTRSGAPISVTTTGIEVERCGSGWLYQLTEPPSLGDVNRQEDTSGYQALDRSLNPIRASQYVNFLDPWDAATTSDWLLRWQRSEGERYR